jgi:tetratricopeptide (TPR) repeat protein
MANMLDDASFSIDARSWAFSRGGLESQRLGNDDAARSLYEQALGHDGCNAQALASLGLLERRRRDFSRAKELLDQALEALERDGQHSPPRDQDWYRARYQLAALAPNKASKPEKRKADTALQEDRQSALAVTGDVARIAARAIKALTAPERASSRFRACRGRPLAKDNPDEKLARFLSTTIQPSAFLLLAGALLLGRRNPRMPKPAPLAPSHDELLRELLDEGTEWDENAPYRLATYVDQLPDLAPLVLYNLACFYTRVKELEKAQWRLQRAFFQTPVAERRALRRVVRNDVTLDDLRERVGLDWD